MGRAAASGAGRYVVRVQGRLDPRWADWFSGFELTTGDDGTTVLVGEVDQPGLHGVLSAVRDLGLPLLSVTRQP